jgi:hypothetical protein
MAAAPKKIWTPDVVRARIRTSALINTLQNYALGRLDKMDPNRIRAAEILLRKALPDLTAVEHSGFVETPPTREEILARLATLHAGTARRPADGPTTGSPPTDGTATTH